MLKSLHIMSCSKWFLYLDHRDETNQAPVHVPRSKKDDDEDEDLNESNYDEVG